MFLITAVAGGAPPGREKLNGWGYRASRVAQAADCCNLGSRNERPPSPTYPIGRTPSSATLGEACKSGPYRAPQQAPEKINLLRFTASSAKPRLQGLSPPSLPLCAARNIRLSISPQFPHYSFNSRPCPPIGSLSGICRSLWCHRRQTCSFVFWLFWSCESSFVPTGP